MNDVYVNSTVRITADFQAWNTSSATPTLEDPVSVTVQIVDANQHVVANPSAVKLSAGIYYVDWTPTILGAYIVIFTGTFANSEISVITSDIEVVNPAAGQIVSNTLEEDQYINFLVDVSPMDLDPEDFQYYFPDASLVEISELIWNYSQEASEIISQVPGTISPLYLATVREFVQASVNCALSRIYDIGNGANELQIGLADLSVTTRRDVKARVTRANATTWCELAGVVREELYRFSRDSGMRAVVRGDAVMRRMPVRDVQHQEYRDWIPDSGPSRGNNFGA